MFFTYDTPTISEIRSGKNIGSAIRRNTYDALVDTLPKINYFYLGSILVTQHLDLRITIMDKILDKFKLAKVRNTMGIGSN